MKTKTIKNVITQKFNDFVSSIDDKEVKDLVTKNTLISGGCIASMLLQEKVNDFDLYFTNKETALAVTEYYVNKFKQDNNYNISVLHKEMNIPDDTKGFPMTRYEEMQKESAEDRIFIYVDGVGVAKDGDSIEHDEEDDVETNEVTETDETNKSKYMPVHISSNAITLSNKIQLVIRFFGEAKEIHKNYDYVHCTNYWLSSNKKLVLNQPALEAILTRELIYIGSKYPIASLIRTRKFIRRHWTITAGQYLKMAYQISKLDLDDVSILEDQLMGVDALYFSILIEKLKAKKEDNPDFTFGYDYICSMIDKIF